MQLVDEDLHRALLYVAMASGHGVGPTRDELDTFASRPERIERRSGGTLNAMLGSSGVLQTMAALVGSVDVESHSKFLERVGWIRERDGHFAITPLGTSIRRALDLEASILADDTLHTVVDPTDDYAYVRVLE